MKKKHFIYQNIFVPAFVGNEDRETENKETKNKETKNKEAKNKETEIKADENGKFTQEQVNKFIATERRTQQELLRKATDEIEALRTRSNLSSKDLKELDDRVETLKNSLLTQEELAKKSKDKLTRKHAEETKKLITERDNWRSRYETSTIQRSISDAASEHKAMNAKQIVRLLERDTQMVAELDSSGVETGNYVPKTNLSTIDEKGRTQVLVLDPSEAVKQMKEMDEHKNLFEGFGKGGLGGHKGSHVGQVSLAELAKGDPAAYREARKNNKYN